MSAIRRMLIRMLAQSGATDGQAILWSDIDNSWVPGDVASGGGGGSGTVTSVTAGDSTINIGGTASDPTVAVNAIAESKVTGLVADLAAKAPSESPVLTGTPTAPTATAGTNTTQIATAAFVQAAITALIGGAPGALDTLKELADAINDDASYAATITAALGLKAPLASPVFTGDPKAPTPTAGDNDTSIATTAFVTTALASITVSDANIAPVAPNDQTGTTYTFVLADGSRVVTVSNPSAIVVTVPPNSSQAFPLDAVLTVLQKGSGQITVVGGAGVTVQGANGLKTSVQWSIISITQIATDLWVVTGDTAV